VPPLETVILHSPEGPWTTTCASSPRATDGPTLKYDDRAVVPGVAKAAPEATSAAITAEAISAGSSPLRTLHLSEPGCDIRQVNDPHGTLDSLSQKVKL